MNGLIFGVLVVLMSVGFGCSDDGGEKQKTQRGFVECGSITCQPGSYCAAEGQCSPGCLSDVNCLAGEDCQLEGAVGTCVEGASNNANNANNANNSNNANNGNNSNNQNNTNSGPSCGDRHCSIGEDYTSCAQDCPPPNRADCVAKCEEVEGICPNSGGPPAVACRAACAAADEAAIAGFLECEFPTEPDACNLCMYGTLYGCGDGRCEALESFETSSGTQCTADCPQLDGIDCFLACADYQEQGCINEDPLGQCLKECYLSSPEKRADFVACADPFDLGECSQRTCIEDFGIVCLENDCGACGDGYCAPQESYVRCPQDCASPCGDGLCTADEVCLCTYDCGPCQQAPACGDLTCNGLETCGNCPQDCGSCQTGGGPGGACRNDFWISKTNAYNPNTLIGTSCADSAGSNCPDGTSLRFPTGECICSTLCYDAGNPENIGGLLCRDLGGTCQQTSTDYGSAAVVCVNPAWNLCSL